MDHTNLSSSDFYDIVTSGSGKQLNYISDQLLKGMSLYLQTVMRADKDHAEDCAQAAFEKVYTGIINGSIKGKEDIYGYLIKAARNEYLMIIRRDQENIHDDDTYFSTVVGTTGNDIVKSLHSEERERLLWDCIDKLEQDKKLFFLKVLKYIEYTDKDAAELLDMTYSNYRTKKSRIIETLRHCVNKSMKGF